MAESGWGDNTDAGRPRAAFRPAGPPPLRSGEPPAGLVTLFLDADETAGLAARAALAVLLKGGATHGDRLLVEVSDEYADGPDQPAGLLTKISTARVWRTGVAASGGRLRDWIILLQECRAVYNSTAVAGLGASGELQQRLASLADRTVVVSRAGARSLQLAHGRLRRLRDQGVSRCECLWLDAA